MKTKLASANSQRSSTSPVYIVRSLYDVMPNELYDGIVVALEDLQAEGWTEKSCGGDSTLDYKDSEDGKDD